MGGDNFSAHVCDLGETMKKRKKNNVIPVRPRNRRGRYAGETSNRPYLLRTVAVGCVVGLAFLVLVGRLFQMMILQHDYYESEAIRNQTSSVSVGAQRGKIYDCNMEVLASSVSVETVFIDPAYISEQKEDLDLIATGLADILDVDADFVREQAADTEMLYKIIRRKIPESLADEVREFIRENKLGGVHLEADSQRSYPCGDLAAQVIGFTNSENQGAEGLEAGYDGLLKGTMGAVVRSRGNAGTEMLYSYEKYYEASNGHDLKLTIDNKVQEYLEQNMQTAIDKYQVSNGAFGIVMDVNTGEIKAMANLGSFDPNDYLEIHDEKTRSELDELYDKALEAKTREEVLAAKEKEKSKREGTDSGKTLEEDQEQVQDEELEDEEQEEDEENEESEKEPTSYKSLIDLYNQEVMEARLKQWRNRTVADGYEPGSTFKTITLASALEEGAVSLEDTWYCGGSEMIERRDDELHCWLPEGHDMQTTAQALQNSCNIAFAHIGIALGGEKLYEYVRAFGLLEKTGIDLPGEGTGYFFDHDTIANPETYAYLTSAAFGQTFKVTPIQLVRAISAVVNGGYVLEPYVVSEVLDDSGNVIDKKERHVLRQAISEQTSTIMCELMESVVTEGTASNAQVVGYAIGGKTGTSEKIDEFDENGRPVDDKIVSFVGVAPIDNPQYIVLVALDTPSPDAGYVSGGVMAAPVVRDVFTDILPYLGITPHYEEEDIHFVNMVMPNVTALSRTEAEQNLLGEHLKAEFIGEGTVVTDQIPSPGAEVPGDSTVFLYLGEEKPTDMVSVPDLSGLTQSEARDTINSIDGLYLQIRGSKSDSYSVAVSYQDIPAGTEVERGTTVTVELTDSSAQD